MDSNYVFSCPLCKCSKDKSVFKGVPSRQELGCDECQDKTCTYLRGEEALKKHLTEFHNIKLPHKVFIDNQEHEIKEI